MIKILCVGKIKEKFYKDATLEYIKRINKYSKIEVIEIPDESTDNPKITLEKEKNKLLNRINLKDYNIILDIEGNLLNSIELSRKIEYIFNNKNSNITFIIGGSCGLHEDIKKLADYSLSFSKLTFPHQLFRVILLEQIYRSFKIINNESYHK